MTTNILLTMGGLIGLVFIGALIKRLQIIPPTISPMVAPLLNSLVVNLTLPATVFLAVLKLRGQPWQLLIKVPLVSYAVITVCGLLAFVVARWLKLERKTAGALIIIAILGSTATLGYTLVNGVFRPADYPNCDDAQPECKAQIESYCAVNVEECGSFNLAKGSAAFYSELGTLIPMLTVAVVIASSYGEGERLSWRNLLAVLKFGPFVAFLLGLLFLNDELSPVIRTILNSLSVSTPFLVMFSLGFTIRWGNFFSRQGWAVLSVNGIKLLLAPALAFLVSNLLGVTGAPLITAVMMSALPALMLCLSYANQYKLDVEFASNALFASFFIGAFTLPIVTSIVAQIAH